MNRDIHSALLAGPSQAARTHRLHLVAASTGALVPEAASGWEALDAGYQIRVAALALEARLDIQVLLGRPCRKIACNDPVIFCSGVTLEKEHR